jgi:magnesium transporter
LPERGAARAKEENDRARERQPHKMSELSPVLQDCLVAEKNGFRWFHVEDVRGPQLDELARLYGLHELAIEDCRNQRQRAKLEDFENHLFLIANNVHFEPEKEICWFGEIDFFVGKDFFISVHDGPSKSFRAVRPRLDADPRMAHPGRLLEAFLDWLVDQYLPVLDSIEDRIEVLETRVVTEQTPALLQEIFAVRRALLDFRRVAVTMREVISHILSRHEQWLRPRLPYFRNIYDHAVRAMDLVENYREILTGVLDVHLTATANRTNEIMKLLSVFATLATPFLIVTGFYGMNFEFMPFLHDPRGPLVVFVSMMGFMLAMLIYFRRRRWL